MLRSTAGMLAANLGLPPGLRDHSRVLDKKGLEKLLSALAEQHPEEYRSVVQHLANVGRHVAQMTGGNSFGPQHLAIGPAGRKAQESLRRQVGAIAADAKLSDDQKEEKVVDLMTGAGDQLTQDVLREALAAHNPLALQVLSGARGNPTNLRSLLAGDLLYVDHRNRPIPVPILRSYSQGLTPAQFFAGTFGARRGVLSTKFAVQDSGYLSKILNQVSHRLVVTALDSDGDGEADDKDAITSPRGLPVPIDDPHNEGALLATDLGPYKRNTVLTPKVLADLTARGHARLLVRSPLVGGHPGGGLYARDLGVREKGDVPPVGDFVGLSAAQSLSEPLTQGALGEKHSGGVAKGRPQGPAGFELIDQYVQSPKIFKGGAAHAQVDGRVSSIRPAPQGGTYVTAGGKDHYVGNGYDAVVKVGDEVEAGDVLSDGLPNPAEVVRHKGVGEGRRYFVWAFLKAYKSAGISAHRRNVEVLARGLIDHVELDDELDEHVPGDVVSYSSLEHKWRPRDGHRRLAPAAAKGLYLERPVLHYSVGTPIRPSVIRDLAEFGVKEVLAHAEPPPFKPVMVRGMENLTHDEDWMSKFLGSYLKKNFLQSAWSGAKSDEGGTSFVPSLVRAVDFGKAPPVKGWTPTTPPPTPPTPAPSILKQMQEAPPPESHDATPSPDAAPPTPKLARVRDAWHKEAADDVLAGLRPDLPEGHVVVLRDDDDDEDDLPDELVYPLPQRRLPGHRDEAGDELAVFEGSEPRGTSGTFVILRPGRLRTRTKAFCRCSRAEADRLLRTFAPLLADYPRLHTTAGELLEDLTRFRDASAT